MKNLTFKLSILIVYVLVSLKVSYAQGNINGYITDGSSNLKIEFAAISLENDQKTYQAQSNEEGYYSFSNIANGKYIMTIYFQGKKQTVDEIIINNNEQNLSIAGNFTNTFGKDDDFVVTIYKSLFRVDIPDVKPIDADIIKNGPIRTIEKAIATTPNVIETPMGLSIKGARPGTAVYYIDGMRTYGELNIPMSSINNIEVYSGAVPAKYGDSTSGIIAVETKSYFDF